MESRLDSNSEERSEIGLESEHSRILNSIRHLPDEVQSAGLESEGSLSLPTWLKMSYNYITPESPN